MLCKIADIRSMTDKTIIERIKTWAEAGKPRINTFRDGQTIFRAAAVAKHAMTAVEGVYWRATSRPDEINQLDVVVSKNHATGDSEDGLCVGVDELYLHSHDYGYKVTGDYIGECSDGFPLLANAKAVSAIMPRQKALSVARREEKKAARRIAKIAQASGVSVPDIHWLAIFRG